MGLLKQCKLLETTQPNDVADSVLYLPLARLALDQDAYDVALDSARRAAQLFNWARWPRLLWVHLAILAWAFSIPFAQLPCPLTDLERSLRAEAGLPMYETHFVDQYFWKPLGTHGETIFNWLNTLVIAGGYVWFVRRRFAAPGQRAV